MNQVGLVGRFTKDPVLRYLSGNRMQTHFSLAINRNFKNNQGEVDTDFVFCTAWGRLAENIVKYCGKGSLIGATGRIQTRSFVNEESTKIFMTETTPRTSRAFAEMPIRRAAPTRASAASGPGQVTSSADERPGSVSDPWARNAPRQAATASQPEPDTTCGGSPRTGRPRLSSSPV